MTTKTGELVTYSKLSDLKLVLDLKKFRTQRELFNLKIKITNLKSLNENEFIYFITLLEKFSLNLNSIDQIENYILLEFSGNSIFDQPQNNIPKFNLNFLFSKFTLFNNKNLKNINKLKKIILNSTNV